MKPEVALILHNIRSVQNVGAIMRTADGVGIRKVYFTGYTPTPIDRFGRARKDFVKASLGAEKFVAWEQASFSELCRQLKTDNYQLIAVEQASNSIDIREINISKSENVAFIFGNEVNGLSDAELSLADVIAEIPMFGKKESLNVSVAAGIALFHILRVAQMNNE